MPSRGPARSLLLALLAGSLPAATAPALAPGVWTDITPPVTIVDNPGGAMCVAFDPQNTTTLYVGMECKVGGGFADGNGIWKSTDGGSTWVQLGTGNDDTSDHRTNHIDWPTCLAVDPTDANHLYATEGVRGRNNGFWVSRDAGANWTRTYSYDLTTLAVDPTDFNHVLVSSHTSDFIGALESKDGGATWILHPPTPGSSSGGTHGLGFLYDPASGQGDANTWILHGENSGVWRTTNAGATWSKVNNSGMVHGATDGGGTAYGKDGALYKAAHPYPLRSRDNGATWETLTQGVPNAGYNTVFTDGDTLYLGPNYPQAGWGVITSANGTAWTQHTSPTLPTRGALQATYDPVRRIVYTVNWSSGLWALKVPEPSVPTSAVPTVATAASATPSPVTGTNTALSVRGADDGGEAALTYTWSTVGTPPAPVVFSPNGRYAARNATATFRKAGTYTLRATIRDAGRQAVTSDVTVTVNPTASNVAVSPTTMVVVPNETRPFSATVRDQFGIALASQPAVTWAVSGGGSISNGQFTAGATNGGPHTVTATSGAANGTASLTIGTTGDGLLGEYYDNDDFTAPTVTRIDPQVDFDWGFGTYATSVGQGSSNDTFTVRWTGRVRPPVTGTYTFTTITDDGVRLWVDGTQIINQWNTVGTFNGTITLNADQMYDLRMEFREVGGGAVARLRWSASGLAQQVIPQARLFSAAPSSPVVPPSDTTPPTSAIPASATPNPVTGTTTALSVLGADNNGEAALTYTWETVGTVPAAVTFTANGSNAAKATTATFAAAGSYPVRVTIRDAAGLTATSTVTVTVNQTTSSLSVTPATVTLVSGTTQTFGASVRDQFNTALASQPAITWSATGNGSITSGGVFTAGAAGAATVTATGGGRSGSASIAVTATATAWTGQDLGSGTLAGSSNVNGDTITITAGGRDIWDNADAGRLLGQPLTGDATITARVVSLTNTNLWAKAGVMIRENTAAGARHAYCCVTPGNGVAFQRRTTANAASAHTGGSFTAAPRWVRLVRSGTTITGYESANGSTWTIVGSTSVGLGNPVQIGLAVTSHDNSKLCTAVFDNVVITPAGSG